MPQYVVRLSGCLSVRPSVTFRYDFHTGWNTSKIISRPNRFTYQYLLRLVQTSAIWSNGNTPRKKIGWNRVGLWAQTNRQLIARSIFIQIFMQEWRFGRSRSSKVMDFGTNRKHACDFLLVRHSNLGPILHSFTDIAVFVLMTPPTPP